MAPDNTWRSQWVLPVDFFRLKKDRYIEVLNGRYNFIFYIVWYHIHFPSNDVRRCLQFSFTARKTRNWKLVCHCRHFKKQIFKQKHADLAVSRFKSLNTKRVSLIRPRFLKKNICCRLILFWAIYGRGARNDNSLFAQVVRAFEQSGKSFCRKSCSIIELKFTTLTDIAAEKKKEPSDKIWKQAE